MFPCRGCSSVKLLQRVGPQIHCKHFPRLVAYNIELLCLSLFGTGYLPSSGGLSALESRLSAGAFRQGTLDTTHASSSASGSVSSTPLRNGAYSGNKASPKRWLRNSDSKVCAAQETT